MPNAPEKITAVAIVLNDNDFGSTFMPLLETIKNALEYNPNLTRENVTRAINSGIEFHYLAFQLGNDYGKSGYGTNEQIIKYLTTTEEAQLLTFDTIDAFPALTTTYDDPVMSEPIPYFGNEPVREIFADVALNMPSQIVSEYDRMIESIWGSILGEVIEGDLTPEEPVEIARASPLELLELLKLRHPVHYRS